MLGRDIQLLKPGDETAMLRAEDCGHIGDTNNPTVVSCQQEKTTLCIGNHVLQPPRQVLCGGVHTMLAKLPNQKPCAFAAIVDCSWCYRELLHSGRAHAV